MHLLVQESSLFKHEAPKYCRRSLKILQQGIIRASWKG